MYRVIYEIDVEGNTPQDAAREAFECMRDPQAGLPMLTVVPWPADGKEPPQADEFYPEAEVVDLDALEEI